MATGLKTLTSFRGTAPIKTATVVPPVHNKLLFERSRMIAYVSDVHENEQANKLFVPLEAFPPQARVERMAYLEGHILLNVLKQNLVAVAEGVLCPRILNFTMNARLFAQCLSFRLITPAH
jgi:hypothetical protein